MNNSKTKHGLNVILRHKRVLGKMSMASDLASSSIPHCGGKDELFQWSCNCPFLGSSELEMGALEEDMDPEQGDLGNDGSALPLFCSVSMLRIPGF